MILTVIPVQTGIHGGAVRCRAHAASLVEEHRSTHRSDVAARRVTAAVGIGVRRCDGEST